MELRSAAIQCISSPPPPGPVGMILINDPVGAEWPPPHVPNGLWYVPVESPENAVFCVKDLPFTLLIASPD